MKRLLLLSLLVLIFQAVYAQRLVPYVTNNQEYILNDSYDIFGCYDLEVFQDSLYIAIISGGITDHGSIAVCKNNLLYDTNIIGNGYQFEVLDLLSSGDELFAVGRLIDPSLWNVDATVGVLANGIWNYYSYALPAGNSRFQFGKFFNQKLYLFENDNSWEVVEFSNGEFTNTGIFNVNDAEVFGDKLYFIKNNTGIYSLDASGTVTSGDIPCDSLNGFSLLNGSLYVSGKCNDFLYRLDGNGTWVPDDLSLDWSKFNTKKLVQVFRTSSGYIGNFSNYYRSSSSYASTVQSFALKDQVSLFSRVQNVVQFENKDWTPCTQGADWQSGGLMVVEKGLKGQALQNENLYKFNTPSFGYFSGQTNSFNSDKFEQGLFYKNKLINYSTSVQVFGMRSDSIVTGYGGQYPSGMNSSYAGPVANEYGNDYLKKHHRIWQVTQAEIDYHNNHWYEANYSAPPDLLEWPGNGDALNGEPQILAPFHDVNGNNIYEPQFGDAPDIKGDEASFYIVSDGREITSLYQPVETARNKSNVEIGVMNYLYQNSTNSSVAHTLFTDYRIVLRDTEPWSNSFFGFIVDFDLGTATDDFIGSDSLLNMIYGYNADEYDEPSSSSNGFGNEVPACGFVGLNADMHAAIYFNNSSNPSFGSPSTNTGIYNYLKGKKLDGLDFIDPITQQASRYTYSGEVGVGSTWNETNVGNPPGDRRMLISFNLGDLVPNLPYCLTAATLVASDTVTVGIHSVNAVTKLKQYVNELQGFYDLNLVSTNCNQLVGVEEVNEELLGVHVYPNPAREKITIQTTRSSISKIELFNIVGSLVHSDTSLRTANASVDVSSYSPGLYSVRIYLEDGTTEVRKIIVE
jgi:hypothetical protein